MNMLSTKQKIEKASAEIFLTLYNQKFNTNFKIIKLQDAPDISCIDPITQEILYLEITLQEDLAGEIKAILEVNNKPKNDLVSFGVRSFSDDVVPLLINRIKEKSKSFYGNRTALVIRQTSPLWETKEWKLVKEKIIREIELITNKNYGMGIWIICTDNSSFPASDTIFRIWP